LNKAKDGGMIRGIYQYP